MSIHDDVRDELHALEAAHRLRTPRVIDGVQGPRLRVDGVAVLNLASNDYLGLASDPRLARAAAAAAELDGVGAGASRLVVGNHRRHVELERALADWLCCAAVRFFNSGYAANLGVITALIGAGDVVFSDELNHASIIDGCRLSRATIVVFPHRDVAALDRALAAHPGRRRLVVSETLFSMDGDLADVAGLAGVCARHGAGLVLDEAHAIGVRGPEGRGVAAAAGVVPDVLIGTCGKALGAFGAFAATSGNIAELLWNKARTLVFTTGLPPMVAAAVEASVAIVRSAEGEERRRAVAGRARMLRSLVPAVLGAPDSAVAPVLVGDDQRVMQVSSALFDGGVFVQGIRPPTVPPGTARLRVGLTASHTVADVEQGGAALLDALRRFT